MNVLKWPGLWAAGLLISCSPMSPGSTNGAFRSPDPDGRIPHTLVETQSAVIDDTISIVAGRREGDGLRAYAGIIPDQPAQDPIVGSATFRGPYAVAFIEDITTENDFVTGRNSILEGTITLQANLTEMTLTGTDGIFTVQARIQDNTQISGEVDVLGVPGTLAGEIGEDRTFGAFYGGDLTHLMSGGFVAARVP